MLGHKRKTVPASLLDGSQKNDRLGEAIIEFKSALMAAYERALERGLCPSHALAAVLSWAANETERLG